LAAFADCAGTWRGALQPEPSGGAQEVASPSGDRMQTSLQTEADARPPPHAQRNARRQPRQERPQQPRAEIDSPGRNQADGDEEPIFDETAARAAEILELMEGLRAFRQRIVDDAQKMAKEIKTPKEQVDACLANHPDICKIDASIRKLETELKAISDSE
ncbi:hypothetical protein F1559_004716, partial [Cyanidiococcus yangmingshanensis]